MTDETDTPVEDTKDKMAEKLAEKKLQAIVSACMLLINPTPREIIVPVSKGVVVKVGLPEKGLTVAEWKAFNAVMYQMRPALTTDDDRSELRAILEDLQKPA